MKKILLLITLFVFYSCGKYGCEKSQELLLKEHCNLIIDKNYNTEKSSFALGTLKIQGRNIKTNENEKFHGDRGWQPFAQYISIGDTVIKKKGEAIMYIYKKDTVVSISYENFCDKTKYDQNKVLKIKIRDSIK
ncbi:hypothetical protein [Faecalibacter macacae]|uniref:Lipoprotein n=1 Tax=Faecalibacter macacae TaxID=1859289 RepID=A0A3L9M2T4_9FLAO|nr:hypothetical protein [Faecalibacter macacae]RLZ07132.1 hypothetical protein EAH69_11825 [Faecalibacter macacae]